MDNFTQISLCWGAALIILSVKNAILPPRPYDKKTYPEVVSRSMPRALKDFCQPPCSQKIRSCFLTPPSPQKFYPPPPPADNAGLCPDGGLCRPSCCSPFVDQVLGPKTHKGGVKTKNFSYGLWPGPELKGSAKCSGFMLFSAKTCGFVQFPVKICASRIITLEILSAHRLKNQSHLIFSIYRARKKKTNKQENT